MLPDVHVVVLAAGKGTRMRSARPKVLHRVAGSPMIDYVLDVAGALSPKSITIVVGHRADLLTAALAQRPGLGFVVQEPQLGTAHALLTARSAMDGAKGTLIMLSGDVPLLAAGTLQELVAQHAAADAALTVITANVANPHGYGRIVRSGNQIERIVEQRDASASEREIGEINSGIYAFALDGLFDALKIIASANDQKEYDLPDLVGIYRGKGRLVQTLTIENADEIRGVNSRAELAEVSRIVRASRNAALMADGVTLEDPATTYIDRGVHIAADTLIRANVSIEGTTRIGEGCDIHSGVRIVNSRLGDRVTILNHCLLTDSVVEDDVTIGPFAHLRNDASIGPKAKVGNFVEIKKSRLGAQSKSMHLTYLGDAVIGANVNIGAGTITCNYDGTHKQTTTINDGAFIGSDSQLVAPVTIGKGAYVGTGTTIREDVPPGALAVSAGKQRNIEGWVERKVRTKK